MQRFNTMIKSINNRVTLQEKIGIFYSLLYHIYLTGSRANYYLSFLWKIANPIMVIKPLSKRFSKPNL